MFHGPGDATYREAIDADREECALRDQLAEAFEEYPGLVTVVLRRGHDQAWEVQSVDPDDEDLRAEATHVTTEVARLLSRPSR
jgi:hypothetical protein